MFGTPWYNHSSSTLFGGMTANGTYVLTFFACWRNVREIENGSSSINFGNIWWFKCKWVRVTKIEKNRKSTNRNTGKNKICLVFGCAEQIEKKVGIRRQNGTMGTELFSIHMKRYVTKQAWKSILDKWVLGLGSNCSHTGRSIWKISSQILDFYLWFFAHWVAAEQMSYVLSAIY